MFEYGKADVVRQARRVGSCLVLYSVWTEGMTAVSLVCVLLAL